MNKTASIDRFINGNERRVNFGRLYCISHFHFGPFFSIENIFANRNYDYNCVRAGLKISTEIFILNFS